MQYSIDISMLSDNKKMFPIITTRSTDSSDSELETMHLVRKHGADVKYKINSEATHALRQIAETANNNPDFTISDVDLTDFGQKIIDVDFDARTLLFDSQNELHSLMALTSESTSGYGSKSSSTSALSFGSVGVPTVKRLGNLHLMHIDMQHWL